MSTHREFKKISEYFVRDMNESYPEVHIHEIELGIVEAKCEIRAVVKFGNDNPPKHFTVQTTHDSYNDDRRLKEIYRKIESKCKEITSEITKAHSPSSHISIPCVEAVNEPINPALNLDPRWGSW